MKGDVRAIIMAAGKGTRLKSELPKVLHPLFGKPLLIRVLETLAPLKPSETCVIVGHGRDLVKTTLENEPFPIETIIQEAQLGTGHAILQVRQQAQHWMDYPGAVLILSGDVPLLETASLLQLLETHCQNANDLTVLTCTMTNPFGYGRVLTEGNTIKHIVEQKDATPAEQQVQTVNTGIYCFDWPVISPLLDQLSNNNAQGEFYLTDLIAMAIQAGHRVGMAHLDNADEVMGVNSRMDLARCHDILNQRTLNRLMDAGVSILNPASSMIAPEVSIGPDTTVLPGCYLQGDVQIGQRCTIGPNTTMSGLVRVDDDVKIIHSMIRDSVIGSFSSVGPFAQLRDGVEISDHVLIGNFVEVKKTTIDHHTNASHLAYLGDAHLGSEVNIGAGTITANYDPILDVKSKTHIEDGVKIGSNSVLVAPVTVGKRATVAAGSVITKRVSPWSLAIARERQVEIPDWVKKKLSPISSA